jgi:hypothetical protein
MRPYGSPNREFDAGIWQLLNLLISGFAKSKVELSCRWIEKSWLDWVSLGNELFSFCVSKIVWLNITYKGVSSGTFEHNNQHEGGPHPSSHPCVPPPWHHPVGRRGEGAVCAPLAALAPPCATPPRRARRLRSLTHVLASQFTCSGTSALEMRCCFVLQHVGVGN